MPGDDQLLTAPRLSLRIQVAWLVGTAHRIFVAIFRASPPPLVQQLQLSLIDRACSRSMLAYLTGSGMCCAQDSSVNLSIGIFLPGRLDQGFMNRI